MSHDRMQGNGNTGATTDTWTGDRTRSPEVITPEAEAAHQAWCNEKLVQLMAEPIPGRDPSTVHSAAERGVAAPTTALPHADPIQRAFGDHDLSGVQAHVGGTAADACADMGATAFASGNHVAFAKQPDLHTAAHEAAHVVQQRAGVQLYGGVGAAGDAYEQQADAVADRVVAGQSAADLLGPAATSPRGPSANVQQRKANGTEASDAGFHPEIKPATQTVTLKKGERRSIRFDVTNRDEAPTGTKFHWEPEPVTDPDTVSILKVEERESAAPTLVVKGRAAGISDVALGVLMTDHEGHRHSLASPRVRVEVGPHLERANAELEAIDRRRLDGEEVDEVRELAARNEAMSATSEEIKKTGHGEHASTNRIAGNVLRNLNIIRNARAQGYHNALTHLSLAQLDSRDSSSTRAFALSLAGNLTWALSGLLAITPAGAPAALAGFFAMQAATRATLLATAVGAGGAMLAQFANGLPASSTGGNVSGPTIALENQLAAINTIVCNQAEHDFYHLLTSLMIAYPPTKAHDAEQYEAELQLWISHMLYGDMLVRAGADAAKVGDDVVATIARDELLRHLAISTGTIGAGGDVVSTRLDANGMGKLTESAVGLLGGSAQLELGRYELVHEQIDRFFREFGIQAPIDRGAMDQQLSAGHDVVLPISWYPEAMESPLAGGLPNRWKGMVERQGGFDPDHATSRTAFRCLAA